jgi:hypothetical protein
MSIHKKYPGDAGELALADLRDGEMPMPLAPCIELDNGRHCVPQHYLQYQQTVETVSSILSDIEALEDMLLFCGSDEKGLYLQVGSIGHDNYDRSDQPKPRRLVYGRKWRIETYTPTSEVIQTALLAIKKACEHEVRELFTFRDVNSGKQGTPFSTHVDLPLMARYPELVLHCAPHDAEPQLAQWLDSVYFDGREIKVSDLLVRANGNIVLDLSLGDMRDSQGSHIPRYGFEQVALTVTMLKCEQSVLLHEIMNALIQHSDRLVDEQFRYRGFARFSQRISPWRVAQLSIATRTRGLPHHEFEPVRKRVNFETDEKRVPSLGAGKLADKNRHILKMEGRLDGHMPLEWPGDDRLFGALP